MCSRSRNDGIHQQKVRRVSFPSSQEKSLLPFRQNPRNPSGLRRLVGSNDPGLENPARPTRYQCQPSAILSHFPFPLLKNNLKEKCGIWESDKKEELTIYKY